ncbi:AAA family ATPase [Salipaludibacillus sp. HK11]|uniref:AAA family ATPase n=1 Tax=Salipaludibacillus sp. HK11 TaxID=3394320 RepID=UPI0039FDD425
MARSYEMEKGDRDSIYDAAKKWKQECILSDKSLIWEEESVWTDSNLQRFQAIFVDNPDESGNSFDQKLQIQLENESQGVHKFVIEILFIYYLFPHKGSASFATKKKKLSAVASWGNIDLDFSQPIFEGLRHGLGATGTFYNTSKYFEISFLFKLIKQLKTMEPEQRMRILDEPWELKKVAEQVRSEQVGKRVQMLHVILHLLLPDYFERISSWGHKYQIVKGFPHLLTDVTTEDTDEQIYAIRKKSEETYPNEKFDFYNKDVLKQWKREKKEPSNKTNAPEIVKEKPKTNVPIVDFDVEPLLEGLVFENTEVILAQITTAIKNGKNIILTGPPGTGKSKLASKICDLYKVESMVVTASSNWSTFETIGGYRPDREGHLYFNKGVFLQCVKGNDTNQVKNKWLIIDEINRADIDKAFGSLFSVMTGDNVTLPFETKNGKSIELKPQNKQQNVEINDHTYIIPDAWRIIATMNTIDKASLYEMSYAFMRRFAFIPIGVPKGITTELINEYLNVWGMSMYSHADTLATIWSLINKYRKIGPSIIEDIAKHTNDGDDFTSAIILYVLPQFEGLSVPRIKEFVKLLVDESKDIIDRNLLDDFIDDFFDAGAW